ncbi:chorismate mutase [Vagococcus vulneris]|uniref:Chorismate mutase domain-containing protein n=1 Tax=Vagococcus vulneris TaxID=1977869 RepID=A0A429ZSY4_9ENTE|nr:chorismate mutase [Vagococcus vulneris]RST96749.1 hypothetical protein CBF37_10635 [Vagococcus vulneris]
MLKDQRDKIDAIDLELVRLLERRYSCVAEIIEKKKKHQLPILDEEREIEVIQKIKNGVTVSEYEDPIVESMQMIMDISKSYQAKK